MRINTQSTSLIFQLNQTNKKKDELFKSLSTMSKLSAKSNPSALAIANSLQSSISSLNTVNQGISQTQGMLDTASGGLSSVMESLQAARELAVQAANGTVSSSDRANLQSAFDQQMANIDSVASNTSFNGQSLLDGSFSSSVMTGSDPNQTSSVSVSSVSTSSLGVNSSGISTQADAADAIEAIDNAIAQVSAAQANVGAQSSALDSAYDNNAVQSENLEAARSQIADADLAELSSELSAQKVKAEIQTALIAKKNKDELNTTKKLLGTG